MKVVWTETAIAHLVDIYEYIASDSDRYAVRMVDRITIRTQQLSKVPQSGEVVPEYGLATVRELIEGPYRIIYREIMAWIDLPRQPRAISSQQTTV